MTFTAGDWLRIFLQVVDRLPLTFLMIVVSLFFAIIIGLLFACIRIKQIQVLKQLAVIYLSFTRSTPLIVQLFLIYFTRLSFYSWREFKSIIGIVCYL